MKILYEQHKQKKFKNFQKPQKLMPNIEDEQFGREFEDL